VVERLGERRRTVMTDMTAARPAPDASVLGPGVFVSHPQALDGAAGGLQICTDEYVRALRTAGVDLAIAPIEHDRRRLTRLARRISPAPYPAQWRRGAVADIALAATRARARFVFLNLVNLAPLAGELKPRLPAESELVLLSHGLESVDFLHTIPLKSGSRRDAGELGRRLLDERRHRASIDHVFCLSSFEAEIERWLGARRVTYVPRTLPDRPPLNWTPDRSRLGFVGTLDHPPTADGLDRFLQALERAAPPACRLRIVGGPAASGRALADRCRLVDYLGPLSDADLEREAATWSLFVHPMFGYARGCSTKLAVALAWRLPIATTPAGARGYEWREGTLPMAETPADLARLALNLTTRAAAQTARDQVAAVARLMPTLDEVGGLMRQALTR
jgi:glycosyltransferase involved in cell wall biosynthesis